MSAACSMSLDDQFEHALADFLADDSTVQAMVCASESGRPAVEAIGTDLVRHFGDRVRPNPVKQHIGRLVRPLLEAQGFVPDKRRATARSILFSRGTVYRCDPEPIATVLDRHGIDVPQDVLRREVREAVSVVVGNPVFAEMPAHVDWSRLAAASTPADLRPSLRVFTAALDHELSEQDRQRLAAETTSQLTPQQRGRLGLNDLRCPATNGDVGPRIRTALKFGALCATALAVPDAAALLQCDASDVTGRVKDRSLYAPPWPSAVAMRLPLFQFDADAPVPKVGNILPALDARIHPVGLFNWFTSPNPDLALEPTHYEPTSPRDWLLHHHPTEPLRRLAASLPVGAAA